jgi:Transposase DDE domain
MSESLYKSTRRFLLRPFKSHPLSASHLRRIEVLCTMISSCIKDKSCTLQGLSTPDKRVKTQMESRIKQAKRWLSSKWTDWESFYAPYIKFILQKLASQGELVLVIDGSEMAGDCTVLMVSVLWGKYAVPLAWMTKEGAKGHFSEQIHLDLINLAASIVPSSCRVVLLGDGEFDGAKLCARCVELQWEFVLRTSLDRKIEDHDEVISIKALSVWPGQEFIFVESALHGYNAVLWHHQKYEHPIPLLTNMDLGQMACTYYEHRFRIELMFKQFKSAGFNVHKCKVKGAKRVHSLIILLALAFLLTFWAGLNIAKMPAKTIAMFARPDRITDLTPVTIAFKALKATFNTLRKLLSDMSKNFDLFFSASG